MPKEKTVAIITINGASDMTTEGRKEVAKWLRQQAGFLLKYGNDFSKKTMLRYICAGDTHAK